MKFLKKILGEEWAELQKFKQLSQDERSIDLLQKTTHCK